VRFTNAYFLFLIYTTAMFGQLIPIIKDVLSHTFAEAIHIATVHTRYGNNHLSKEIEDSTGKENKATYTKHAENFEVHIISEEYNHSLSQAHRSREFSPLILKNIDLISVSKQSPPPRSTC
jgi:hypothetical protein